MNTRSRFLTRVLGFAAALGALIANSLPAADKPEAGPAAGPFQPTDESLKHYQCPEWFRDAKLGIWAVWGPESVPMQGDWYARNLYLQGGAQNKFHVDHYGHPSKFGFKDIIPLWKAEKWEPDQLMALYQKAGAKYFCMIAMHHDNFDCWDSKFQRWNAVNMGPRRDIAGEWQAAARKLGLRFGMTEHLAASWWFYSAAKGADATGPMAGVPYDGVDPKFAELYWSGNEKPDGNYYLPNAPDAVKQVWFNRVKDMVDRYHPDLVYSDSPLPYPDEYGRKLLAHFYNDNLQQHAGRLEAIYNCKQDSEGRWVQDLERGVMPGISPHPWQTDTCVGGWYYQTGGGYKSSATVLQMLADIVSKNGNLLLNFPPRPDGTLDDQELKILADLAAWMPINGEAIFGTRPWTVYGEGPARAKGGMFNEDELRYSAEDIRFTTKGGTLYALALGWPDDRRLVVRSLAAPAGKISEVGLLGCGDKLAWAQTDAGLVVTLPEKKPCEHVFALSIRGTGLKPVPVPSAASSLYQESWGSLTNHATPQWYADAKFGIYYHWGIYSVPAFGSEWYSRNMYQKDSPELKHHVATFGPLDQFGYKDFIPRFTAEKFDAQAWVDLFQKAGARFVGPVAEHADGFSMWDSQVNPWNAARLGARRDLVGEMERAARQKNLKFIATFHHQWLWGWYATLVTNADVFDSRYASFYGRALGMKAFDYEHPDPKPDLAFCDQWLAKVGEVVDRYHPDLIYFDSRSAIIDEGHRLKMLAHYYNQAQDRGQEVVMTYKNNDFMPGAGVVDLECGRMAGTTPYKWQTDDVMDWNSWAYLEKPNYKPASRLVHQLADIVSKNGNLLLDVGPRPDGTIPEPVQERLLQIGAWLKVNGEAIYGTRPFTVFGEGPTRVKEGHFGETALKEFTPEDIRFTTKGANLYAIALGWPTNGTLRIKTLAKGGPAVKGAIQQVDLLGSPGPIKWVQDEAGLTVELPPTKPCDYAWTLRITGLVSQ